LSGHDLGPVPLVACHRHRRPFAQHIRDDRVQADFLSSADRVLQGYIAAFEVTAKDARDPLQERRCRRFMPSDDQQESPRGRAAPVSLRKRRAE
jgi:hypothetical protein